jgi:phage terminase large subunit
LAGLTVESLLALPDAELDDNEYAFLTTRRWVKERYAEWFFGDVSNSPLWASRVLGEFPATSTNALFPLSWLEAARRPAVSSTGDTVIGCDPAGPGKDRTVCVACVGGSIVDTMISSAADARGDVMAFLKKHGSRLRIVNVDSAGLGWYLLQHIRDAGYRCQGINVGSSATDKERFSNLKAERYWYLRERFQRGEISGLSDECLSELAAISYLVDPRGKTAIEDKTSVKSTLGKSPDLAESLMLALGEPTYEPFVYRPIPNQFVFNRSLPGNGRELTGREQDAKDDAEAAAQRRSRQFGFNHFWGNKGSCW